MDQPTDSPQQTPASPPESIGAAPAPTPAPSAPVETAAVEPADLGASTPSSLAAATAASTIEPPRRDDSTAAAPVDPGRVSPSTCGCGCGSATPAQLVNALGQLGFDFGTEARRDSIMQHMKQPANPHDPNQLLAYLEENPWDATEIIWTLNLDATPIYAVQPQGPFASQACERLRQFLKEQLTEGVERSSHPGWIVGSTRLFTGQVVPVIHPVIRGMYSWTTGALVEAVCGKSPAADASQATKDAYAQKAQPVENFLRRVYDELRNLGVTPQERAMNYSATNALLVTQIFEDAIKEEMDLDTIEVKRSPICRPDSDCWDVKLTFFDPKKVFERARKVYRFCCDVSDPVPCMVGPVRSWFVR